MGTAGIVFGAIAIAWLVYLVPSMINRRNDFEFDQLEVNQRFSESMRIIRRASMTSNELQDPYLEVSTPLTRAAALAEIRRAYRTAANRRVKGTFALVALIPVVAVFAVFTTLSWWTVLVPVGLLVGWLGLCRFNHVTFTAELDSRMAALESGWIEETIAVELPLPVIEETSGHEFSVEISAANASSAWSGWDSIPVTPVTYVSQPLAPRTVRTIDLAAPMPSSKMLPPTAEPLDIEEDTVEGANSATITRIDEAGNGQGLSQVG